MIRSSKSHSISGVFVFLLLGVFAVFGTILVLLGSQAYRNTVDRTAAHNETRVLQAFVRHAVRAEDAKGAVTVCDLDGIEALCIADEPSEDAYRTYIYACDGTLRELYTAADMPFSPDRGEVIADASAFTASIEGHRLSVSVTDSEGRAHDIVIALYGGEVQP